MNEDRITSLHNPRVKLAARLREARQRQKQGRFLIDGAREILRALEAGVAIVEVFVCAELCAGGETRQVLDELAGRNVAALEVTPQVFEKLAFGQRTEGVLAVATPPERSLAALVVPRDALVAVVEGVEKPGNLGAILRSADGAGVSAVIVADGSTDLYNPNAIRASLGTIFTLPVVAATSAEALDWLRARGMTIFAARLAEAVDYATADFTGPSAIVLGSEARGLSAAWYAADVRGICLPMLGAADSLNVSATASVLFYEARRQRRLKSRPDGPAAP